MMKKTVLSTAIVMTLGAPIAAYSAGDTLNIGLGPGAGAENLLIGGALSNAQGAQASTTYTDSNNIDNSNSFNAQLAKTANDVNSDNDIVVVRDAVVAIGERGDQAVATSDLDNTVQNNIVYLGSVRGQLVGQGAIANTTTQRAHTSTNTIDAAFSGASGMTLATQNVGNAGAMAQSFVVQSNLALQ